MFCKVKQGDMVFWKPVHIEVVDGLGITANEESDSLSFSFVNNTQKELKGILKVNNNTISEVNIPAKSGSENFIFSAPLALMGTNKIELKTEQANYSLQTINWNIKNADNVTYQTIDIKDQLNEKLNDIFEYGKYMSPRSPYTTLQVPTQGMGNWCHPYDLEEIDDSGLREKAGANNLFNGPGNIPFSTPGSAGKNNIAFSTLWNNYPDSLSFALSGKAAHAYLLMAGSSNHMQANFVNGIIKVKYKDQSEEILELILPDSWEPIERYIYTDGFAFTRNTPKPYRVELSTGELIRDLKPDVNSAGPVYIKGGAAIVLDIPLDNNKELESLSLETRANEVVIGIMSITLLK